MVNLQVTWVKTKNYVVAKKVIHRKLLFIEITVATLFFAPLFSLFVSSVCLPFTSYNECNIQFIIIGKKKITKIKRILCQEGKEGKE